MSTLYGRVAHMTTGLTLLILAVGIAIGTVIGWLARGNRDAGENTNQINRLARTLEERSDHRMLIDDFSTSLQPLQDGLNQLTGRVHSLDVERAQNMSSLAAQVQSMTRTSALLSDRTNKLVQALRAPQVRGRWGEMQLERVVEMAGMQRHVDFDTQVSVSTSGRTMRPDMVIKLSGGRTIVVDAKAPFTAYLDALDSIDPEEHEAFLRRHAYQLRQHVIQLSSRDYTSAFTQTPEFVVLFVPADPFLDAALTHDSDLLEYAFARDIVLATPSTLMVLLRTIAMGWQQAAVTEQAAEVQRLGKQLYSRLNTMASHYNRVGQSLDKAVDAYNSTLNSIDSRIMVTARKLSDMNVVSHTATRIVEPKTITIKSKHASDPENDPETGSEAEQTEQNGR